MDSNRLQLNFNGNGGRGNGNGNGNGANGANGFVDNRNYQTPNDRVYPTTPSTFPHSVFSPLRGPSNNEYLGGQVQSPNIGGYSAGAGGGYFGNAQYQPQYAQTQQNQYAGQYQQQNIQPSQAPFSQRQGGYAPNDPTTGLARQFSNQNLGSGQRQGSPYIRQPSPNQRPRTGGATGQPSYGNHLTLPIPGGGNSSQALSSQDPPEQDPNKYADNISKKVTGFGLFIKEWFKTKAEGTRNRNAR